MHDTAKTILELSLSDEAEPVLNLVHPRPVRWRDVIHWVRCALHKTLAREELPIISPKEWLVALELRGGSEDLEAIVSFSLACILTF